MVLTLNIDRVSMLTHQQYNVIITTAMRLQFKYDISVRQINKLESPALVAFNMSHCIEYSVYKKMMSDKQAKKKQRGSQSDISMRADDFETERKQKKFGIFEREKIHDNHLAREYSDRSQSCRRNLFDENRELKLHQTKQNEQISRLNSEIYRYETTIVCIIDAIKRVYSQEVAEELKKIISEIENTNLSHTDDFQSFEGDLGNSIYQALMHHSNNQSFEADPIASQREEGGEEPSLLLFDEPLSESKQHRHLKKSQFPDVKPFTKKINVCADWGQAHSSRCQDYSHKIGPLSASHSQNDRRISQPKRQSKLSCNITNQLTFSKDEDCCESTDRSHQVHSTSSKKQVDDKIVATNLICQNCQKVWTPNAFLTHVHECQVPQVREQIYQYLHKWESNNGSQATVNEGISMGTESAMEDTQDVRLRRESENFEGMMNSLISIKDEIESQINLLKYSKQKIDRDAQRRKLEKDLAKVNRVIKTKKQQIIHFHTNGSQTLHCDLENSQKTKNNAKKARKTGKAGKGIRD